VTILAGDLPTEEAPAGSFDFEAHEGLMVYRLALQSLDPDANFFWPAAAHRLRAIVGAERIETVHFHNVMGLGANLIPAAKEAGAKCVVTLHDHWGFCFRQTRLRPNGSLCNNFDECAGCMPAIQPPGGTALPMRLRRDYVFWCLNQADYLLSPSAYLAGAYVQAGFAAGGVQVVSNGIDLASMPDRPKESSPDGEVRFLCSAYLGEHKGIPVLLEAVQRLANDRKISRPWQVTIAGEGHLRPSIEKVLKDDRISQHLRFAGRVSRAELISLMSQAEIAVLPSVWPENEPVTMLEAIATGTAQIATSIGGNLELVKEGQSGFLIAPGDASELAGAMRRYIDDPSLVKKHGAFNRQRRERFDEANTISRLEEIYAAGPESQPERKTQQPVVICGTGWPALEVGALTRHVHEFMMDGIAPRFIWREWADDAVWREAAMLWLWDRHPEEWLVNMALRHGVAILAAANPWAEGLARHYGGVVLYRTYAEALASLRTILSIPGLRAEIAMRARAASAAATAMAPPTAFALKSEQAT
jgi:glycosyltransferase involved in cell wall biosynthesis